MHTSSSEKRSDHLFISGGSMYLGKIFFGKYLIFYKWRHAAYTFMLLLTCLSHAVKISVVNALWLSIIYPWAFSVWLAWVHNALRPTGQKTDIKRPCENGKSPCYIWTFFFQWGINTLTSRRRLFSQEKEATTFRWYINRNSTERC